MLRILVCKQKTVYEMLRSLVGKQKTAYEMLRSLVGSEMCIRDRLPPWERRTGRTLTAREGRGGGGERSHWSWHITGQTPVLTWRVRLSQWCTGMDLVDRQLPRNLTADDSDSHLLLLHSVSLIRDFRDPQDRLVDRRRMRGPAVHLNVVVSRESRRRGPEASRGRGGSC